MTTTLSRFPRPRISTDQRDFAHAIKHDLVELQTAQAIFDRFAHDLSVALRGDLNTKSGQGTRADALLQLDDWIETLGRDTLGAGITQLEGMLEDAANGYTDE